MPENRYFYNAPLTESIKLVDLEHRHLSQVMRKKQGDAVEIVNGRGELGKGTILAVEKRETTIAISDLDKAAPPDREVILAQAIPRMNRLDTIIEKGTELGVTQFWLFPGDRSERKELSANQLERLKNVTIAALKQSGRLWLPEILIKESLKKWNEIDPLLVYGDPHGEKSILQAVTNENVVLLIGPESGLSPNEEEWLAKLNGKGVLLHKNILRTDTAAIAGLALLNHTNPTR